MIAEMVQPVYGAQMVYEWLGNHFRRHWFE
jgi:hypothetical protein